MKRLVVGLGLVLAVGSLWALEAGAAPRYRGEDGRGRRQERRWGNRWEIEGLVQGFDPRAGWIRVNHQWWRLARRVKYENGRPRVGDWVEVQLRREGNQWVVYAIEREGRRAFLPGYR